MRKKSRQIAENKQTFGLKWKIENEEKSRQIVENKQTWVEGMNWKWEKISSKRWK